MREQSKFKPKEGILGRLELRKTPSSDNDKSLFTRFELSKYLKQVPVQHSMFQPF